MHYPNFKQNKMPSQSQRQMISTVQHLLSAYPFSRRRCLHHWKAECTGKIRIGSKITWILFYFLPCSITNELKHQKIRCFNILRTWVCSPLTWRKKNPINLKWRGSGQKQRCWQGYLERKATTYLRQYRKCRKKQRDVTIQNCG